MACTVQSCSILGVDGVPVQVEVDLLRRLPGVTIVGLAGSAVRESSERVRSSIQRLGAPFPKQRVIINLAPADLRKNGTAFDLPIAVGIICASGQAPIQHLSDTVFIGELSLEGELRSIRGALAAAYMARQNGARRVVLPEANAREAGSVNGITALGARNLEQVVSWLKGLSSLQRPTSTPVASRPSHLDLSEVRGQQRARRALELTAAGDHNLLLMGPPGCGKSMLAARLPSILPRPTDDEALEISRIHSVAGLLPPGTDLLSHRPFQAPHHTISVAGMYGNAALAPGELTLAHLGVLFLDELPEFDRRVLELLRSPLETGRFSLSRAAGTVQLPARVTLVASANPCACGYLGHPERACICTPAARNRYRSRSSGPLLDRIDLQVWVGPVPAHCLTTDQASESSREVNARVLTARARQAARLM
ncbi:MAG: YifB family Mg chelatase-like AAA ATPase, partial [Myxococcota bacterium]|nr:YifB family Mg chelatase-like AAA ATPase [Myxococcota bacterium]